MRTNLYRQKKFWVFHGVVVCLTTAVDHVSSGLPIVIFNPEAIIGLRFFSVPLENYLFGFSLITVNLIAFEWWSRFHET